MSSIVLLVPAAGSARRLIGHRTGSKEVIDIAGQPVAAHLLQAAEDAGIERALFVVRHGKSDIEAILRARPGGPALEFLSIAPTRSVPETLRQGLGHLRADNEVALGFPDVLFTPNDALARLVHRYRTPPVPDILLGLFPTDRPDKADMVQFDASGRVRAILVKPGPTDLRRTWLLAIWGPRFSRFLETWVDRGEGPGHRENQVSDVFNAALAAGWIVESLDFASGSHLDIGTPEDLNRARSQAPQSAP